MDYLKMVTSVNGVVKEYWVTVDGKEVVFEVQGTTALLEKYFYN